MLPSLLPAPCERACPKDLPTIFDDATSSVHLPRVKSLCSPLTLAIRVFPTSGADIHTSGPRTIPRRISSAQIHCASSTCFQLPAPSRPRGLANRKGAGEGVLAGFPGPVEDNALQCGNPFQWYATSTCILICAGQSVDPLITGLCDFVKFRGWMQHPTLQLARMPFVWSPACMTQSSYRVPAPVAIPEITPDESPQNLSITTTPVDIFSVVPPS